MAGAEIVAAVDAWNVAARTFKRNFPHARVVNRRLSMDAGPEILGRDIGKVDLLTAYACLKHARLFIGNDSGLMHIAAAAGVPTVGLFGPSDDRLYGPWGVKARVVRGPRTLDQIIAVDPSFQQAVCHMMDLPVDTVVAAAKDLLAET